MFQKRCAESGVKRTYLVWVVRYLQPNHPFSLYYSPSDRWYLYFKKLQCKTKDISFRVKIFYKNSFSATMIVLLFTNDSIFKCKIALHNIYLVWSQPELVALYVSLNSSTARKLAFKLVYFACTSLEKLGLYI